MFSCFSLLWPLGPIMAFIPLALYIYIYKKVFAKACSWCPYNADRVARGLDATASIGPDEAEQFAHSSNFLIEQAQSRKTAGKSAPVRSVPLGLSSQDHFAAAIAVTSPLDKEPPLADDLDFAIRTIVEQGETLTTGAVRECTNSRKC